MQIRPMFRRILSSKSGATAIEYGLLAAIMGVVLVTGFNQMGIAITDVMLLVGNTMVNAIQ